MGQFSLAELPSALAEYVPVRARLSYPTQGKTSDVAFAEHDGRVVVVKRCAHPVYLEWLRREQAALRALEHSALSVPRFIAYAEDDANGSAVGWLVMSRLAGSPLLAVVRRAAELQRRTLFRSLGELVRRLHATAVPRGLARREPWVSRQLVQARANLPWCDGTAVGLAELERSRPAPVAETLMHGDLALDNVLVDAHGSLSLIDWADGGPGDPRHDLALALQTKPELELSAGVLDAFAAGYGGAVPDAATRDWFVRLYDYF
jgi:aminoglycoside phosphotransferase (APT) family kinase protein